MIQLGDFHFGDYQLEFNLDRAMLLGWVTNTYWETNFRAHQPGLVYAHYTLQPYAGGFDEARAHRFGLEAANARPLMQHFGETPAEPTTLPASGSLLELPGGSVLPIHVKAAEDGSGIIVRLLNASEQAQTATLGSGLLKIAQAKLCDLLENQQRNLSVNDGKVSIDIPARQIAVVWLKTE
jgi:alpha-mannosidase